MKKSVTTIHWLSSIALLFFLALIPIRSTYAQDYVTGSFEGEIKDSITGSPIVGATVRITNQETGVPVAKQTDSAGRFRQGLLPPGDYTITVVKEGYVILNLQRSLPALRPTVVLPPVPLVREVTATATASPTPASFVAATPGATPLPTIQPTTKAPPPDAGTEADIRGEINTIDAQRGGTFSQKEVSNLPLGAITRVRTFDELALLLPGVAPPPQTQGEVAGPGVGAGVGSAGQFAVNGLRSRANNFTVDGSDNNDEDIGVRRQGFLALVPQPIESIREFQVITLLAPAQYGRNIGAQVNAVSRSGGNQHHGTMFGFLNSSQLNAKNFFDSVGGPTSTLLQGRALDFNNQLTNRLVEVRVNNQPKFVTNNAAAEDSFTLGQFGFVLGGPLNFGEGPPPTRPKLFYFISAEKQILNAQRETNFVVPTVEERGLNNSGASGLVFPDPFVSAGVLPAFPTSNQGDAIFSLFPFPNNPSGLFGRNTLTQVLPAGGEGLVLSGKINGSFRAFNREHQWTARYNFTDDERTIAVTGGAIFSSLRPRVQTQNFSTFLNSELTGPDAARPIFNQLRLSYGRTRLAFDEVRDKEFLRPSSLLPNTPFLLNAPYLSNETLPTDSFVDFRSVAGRTVETGINGLGTIAAGGLGPVGQVIIAGFSPVGVDVFNFPQKRVNNTYQVADTATLRAGAHSFAFGTDIRRTELNSDLPRNSRPLITFNGAPNIDFDVNPNTGAFTNVRFTNFIDPASLAAASAASGFFQSQTRGALGSNIGLRYYQFNFFGQDEWRVSSNLSLSYGLRYEYNTPPGEVNRIIERSFNSPALDLVPDLRTFIAGRKEIFDPDRQNFAPRVGFAWSPTLFGDKLTVIRAGYGIFYDQILGAVVSQSRNVFENFLTINFGGGIPITAGNQTGFSDFTLFNPATNGICFRRDANFNCVDFRSLIVGGTLNQSNNNIPLRDLVDIVNANFPGGFGFTLPARNLQSPMAQEYSVTLDQQLSSSMVLSAGYVGTRGSHLLRVTTPNLGPNTFIGPLFFDLPRNSNFVPTSLIPFVVGLTFAPGERITSSGNITGGRPVPGAGSVTIYESTATSRYDALQLQLRGRYHLLGATQFQVNYTYGKVTDDVSDVFDLAGASALPQNSLTFAGERGHANFDVRHRVSSSYISDFSGWGKNNPFWHVIFGGLEVAGSGTFQTGQPFTVNSINDVNLDGNLTDRLNSTTGIVQTGDRAQPLRLTVNPATLLAPVGKDGSVPRNSFRAGNLWLTNAAVIKTIRFSEDTRLILRAEAFNLFNRANFGVPIRFLESPGFGRATETVTSARRIQLGLKLSF
jgi:hypothetical protein